MPSERNGEINLRTIQLLVYLALALAGGGGIATFTQTSDRYHGADAMRDLALRDSEIRHMREKLDAFGTTLTRIDDTHPPPELIKALDELRNEMRELEQRIRELELAHSTTHHREQ